MHQTLSHYPAPNFGKTFGPSVTTGQSWTFGDASSLSEIGRRERKLLVRRINRGSPMPRGNGGEA